MKNPTLYAIIAAAGAYLAQYVGGSETVVIALAAGIGFLTGRHDLLEEHVLKRSHRRNNGRHSESD